MIITTNIIAIVFDTDPYQIMSTNNNVMNITKIINTTEASSSRL